MSQTEAGIQMEGAQPSVPVSLGPWQRAWRRFKGHRRAWWSLWIFGVLFVLSLFAEVLSSHKPLLVRYQGEFYAPLFHDYPETVFGGDFVTPTDYLDPYIQQKIEASGWLVFPPNRYRYDTINYFGQDAHPAAPSRANLLGTDDRGRDILARLIYGFRVSVLFAFALTAIGVLIGTVTGAVQGYFAGRVDLALQRLIEIWSSMPELYLIIIFASIFQPGILVLLLILSAFGWISLEEYVRAEFLRGRNLEYVMAARAMGVSNRRIMWRHLLPNSLTPIITFLPFRISGAVVALTSLDFLGLGVPPSTPSLGELLAQGKANLDAWWIVFPTFTVLVGTLLLLIFIAEGLREAFDPRKG